MYAEVQALICHRTTINELSKVLHIKQLNNILIESLIQTNITASTDLEACTNNHNQ